MADHADLIAEFPQVEKMTTEERMKHARKRRVQQMKKWSQREKSTRDTLRKKKKTELNQLTKRSKLTTGTGSSQSAVEYKVHFVPSVMLLEAAARGDVEEVQRLLMLGFDADSKNEDGLTALHQCCIDNNEDMMKLLLEFGANVNAEDSERWTPLHAAATCGHISLVKYLINKGANLLAVNADGNMPYDICEDESTLDYVETEMSKRGVTQELIDDTRSGTEKIMLDDLKWLAQQNGDLEYRDHQGAAPLHIASANGFLAVVEFLLDHNVSLDVVDDDYWQPIHAAACWGHSEVLELLVQSGACLDARTKNGETPFDICEDMEMKERMMQLKDEMEIKKSVQPHRLRRSQSQNTRSRSVRRTSLRDKNHMTRKEAMEEAKIRLVHQGMQPSGDAEKAQFELESGNKENIEKNYGVMTTTMTTDRERICVSTIDGKQKLVMPVPPLPRTTNRIDGNRVDGPPSKDVSGAQLTNGDRIFPLLKTQSDVTTMTTARNGMKQNSLVESNRRPSSSPLPRRSNADPVVLDVSVHLTVNSGTLTTTNGNALMTTSTVQQNNGSGGGTLADLKRQRNVRRHSASVSTVESSQAEDDVIVVVPNGHGIVVGYSPMTSPTLTRKKFTASTAEVIGSTKTRQCCCVIL